MVRSYIFVQMSNGPLQAWANNSTSPFYSTRTRRFRNYSCMNLRKSRPGYSTPVRVEYLYFRRIESSRVEPNYFADIWSVIQMVFWIADKIFRCSDYCLNKGDYQASEYWTILSAFLWEYHIAFKLLNKIVFHHLYITQLNFNNVKIFYDKVIKKKT